MATAPRVSFVIPARNEDPAVVEATVAGVLATTPPGWREIIVVDDASATKVDVHAPGITVIRHEEPVGVSRARRAGARAANGDVLVWLDAHLTFGGGWLQALLAEVESGALLCTPWRDYARTAIRCWGSDFGWANAWEAAEPPRPGFDYAPRRRRPRGPVVEVPMIVGGCYAMARDAYERLGGVCPLFRVYWGDEFDLSARAWLGGSGVRCVAGAEVGHLDRPRHPYPVSWSHVEHNQVVLIRTVFETDTAAVLEEFLHPLGDEAARWVRESDVEGWRREVQGRRRIRDDEFFRRLAPRVPVTFVGGRVVIRRGHVPRGRQWAVVAAEERALAGTAVVGALLASPRPSGERAIVAGSSFGVRFTVGVPDASWLPHIVPRLPPGPVTTGGYETAADVRVAVVREPDDGAGPGGAPDAFAVEVDGQRMLSRAPLAAAVDALERRLDHAVGARARDHLFVRASVVAWKGRALVLTGGDLTGRRALTVALVRAGAIYYSDTFAVIDAAGRVWPYRRPTRLDGASGPIDLPAAGPDVGPVRIGVVATIAFGGGRTVSIRTASAAHAFRALFERTLAPEDRSEAVRILSRAVRGATVLTGRRGPTGPVVTRLLGILTRLEAIPSMGADLMRG